MNIVELDPMTTSEFAVEHVIKNVMDGVWDLDTFRRSNEAREVIMRDQNYKDLELTRDKLSRILDDVGGKQ